MGRSGYNFQVVYPGETLQRFVEGGWVFPWRLKEYGSGYSLGRTRKLLFSVLTGQCFLSKGVGFMFTQ